MDNAFENLKLVFDSPPESGARARNEPEGPAHVQESPLMRFRVQSKDPFSEQEDEFELQLPASASSFDHEPPHQDGSDRPDSAHRRHVQVWLEAGLLDSADVQRLWRLNYHEASVYLAEGQANDKLHLHPSGRQALKLYLLVHSSTFHRLHLFAAILLLLLGLCEQPAVPGWKVPAPLHAIAELSALLLLIIELIFRLRWTGWQAFVRHTRSMLATGILLLMITEALFVLGRQNTHFRPTRAFRPLFLIDSAYCGGVRRVLRQILQSLPPVLDMLVLLLFCILVFALSAFYLFSDNPIDPHFSTLERSFVSLFVLLTTANFPDVMMPAYARSRSSAIFFIAYLIISLYFLMNLMLAVVYETFTRIEKHKFRKLLLHRRSACDHAFKLLVSRTEPNRLAFRHFRGLMAFFRPNLSPLDCYLTFKTLDDTNNGYVTKQQFYRLYEVMDLRWSRIASPEPALVISRWSAAVIRWTGFEYLVHALVAAGTIWQLHQAHTIRSTSAFSEICNQILQLNEQNTTNSTIECTRNTADYLFELQTSPVTITFVVLFAIECGIRVLALGIRRHLADPWNRFEFFVTSASVCGLAMAVFGTPFTYVYVLRSVRLLRLFGLQRRYRDVMGTFMFILLRRFLSVLMVVLVVFYSFAILGVELFAGLPLQDCCKNTELEPYFRSNLSGLPTGYYYLNNFDNLMVSYVTLFQLMVANNWHIIMGGYALVSSEWSRLYFMVFYIITMVVITIVVAFVLEAFLFRIQYKKKMGDIDRDTKVIYDLTMNQAELDFCLRAKGMSINAAGHVVTPTVATSPTDTDLTYHFHGERTRTKFLFSMKMYADEVREWIEQDERQRTELMQQQLDGTSPVHRPSRRTYSCSY